MFVDLYLYVLFGLWSVTKLPIIYVVLAMFIDFVHPALSTQIHGSGGGGGGFPHFLRSN